MVKQEYPTYTTIWFWLVALLVFGVVAAYLPVARTAVVTLIFATALAKAFLVARHYMHLRSESLLIYAIGGVPVLLLIGMALALVPDLIWNR